MPEYVLTYLRYALQKKKNSHHTTINSIVSVFGVSPAMSSENVSIVQYHISNRQIKPEYCRCFHFTFLAQPL